MQQLDLYTSDAAANSFDGLDALLWLLVLVLVCLTINVLFSKE
jgi:hypothetical protein